jgi:glycosyltransferase involved in cell wall biosynthesis
MDPKEQRSNSAERRIELGINAVQLTEGGGVTGLLGYVEALGSICPRVRVTVFAARANTIAALASQPVKVVRVPMGHSLLGRAVGQLFLLGRIVTKHQCDVLLTTNSLVPYCRVPQVVHHRNLWSFESPRRNPIPAAGRMKLCLLRQTARRALVGARVNVFVSSYLRQAACSVSDIASRGVVIPNGLSTDLVEDARVGVDMWLGRPHLLSVSYANAQKNNHVAIAALSQLAKRYPSVPWHLTITGGGDWAPFEIAAERLGVRSRIAFPGYLSKASLRELYRGSVCLLFTSSFESFGNPPLEAMSQGCPVVASAATAIPEVVGDAGILVPSDDASAFAAAAAQLWEESQFRQAFVRRGHARALQHTWRQSASMFCDVFTRICSVI